MDRIIIRIQKVGEVVLSIIMILLGIVVLMSCNIFIATIAEISRLSNNPVPAPITWGCMVVGYLYGGATLLREAFRRE